MGLAFDFGAVFIGFASDDIFDAGSGHVNFACCGIANECVSRFLTFAALDSEAFADIRAIAFFAIIEDIVATGRRSRASGGIIGAGGAAGHCAGRTRDEAIACSSDGSRRRGIARFIGIKDAIATGIGDRCGFTRTGADGQTAVIRTFGTSGYPFGGCIKIAACLVDRNTGLTCFAEFDHTISTFGCGIPIFGFIAAKNGESSYCTCRKKKTTFCHENSLKTRQSPICMQGLTKHRLLERFKLTTLSLPL